MADVENRKEINFLKLKQDFLLVYLVHIIKNIYSYYLNTRKNIIAASLSNRKEDGR
jgi:hypothetical protein